MNKTRKSVKQILIVLGVAVLALIVYALLSGSGSKSLDKKSGLVSTQGKALQGQIREKDIDLANNRILKVLESVRNIQLNDEIFKNPIFLKLKDSRFSIPRPVRVGRPNPFASIGAEYLTQEENEGEEQVAQQDVGEIENLDFLPEQQ